MILSMTGYAEYDIHTSIGMLRFELKSLNHRYLEINFKLPDWARDLEISLRDIARRRLGRGKIDCILKLLEVKQQNQELKLDVALVDQLILLSKKIQERIPESPLINAIDLLKWPNVIKLQEYDIHLVKDDLEEGFNKAIDKLINNRRQEGKVLSALMLERIQKMEQLIATLRNYFPSVLVKYRERLLSRLQDLHLEPDEKRLEQELVYLSSKLDIEEEWDRFSTHLNAAKKILTEEENAGKKLDFLMQELNREANTMASKSIDSEVTQIIIALKVLIEQLREQVQNLA